MAEITGATTTAIDDTVNHQVEAATHTGDSSNHTPGQSTKNATQSDSYQVVGQRPNLLYTEDLGYLPMQKDPRSVFYRHEKTKKFDMKNEDL